MASNPYKNRQLKRVDVKREEGQIEKVQSRQTLSKAYQKNGVQLDYILNVVRNHNVQIADIFLIQSLTGLRYTDASELLIEDFFSKGKMVDKFDFYPSKSFNRYLTAAKTSDKMKDWSISRQKNYAYKKSRLTVYVPKLLAQLVEQIIQETGKTSGLLVPSLHPFSGGNPPSIQYSNRLLKKIAQDPRYQHAFANLGTHSFRKGFAERIFSLNGNHLEVSTLLGHNSLESVRSYIVADEENLKKLVLNESFEEKP